MAQVIQSKGIQKGDRVALVSKNCAWWILTDLAIMMSGAVSVPIYPNVNAEILSYILDHSGSKLMFAGKLDTWEEIKPGVPADMSIIGFPYYEASGSESWNALLESADALESYEERAMDEMLTIIYTSGTTGKPKGVVHNLSSFTYAMNMFPKNIDAGDHNERAMSYLPLAHIAERALIEFRQAIELDLDGDVFIPLVAAVFVTPGEVALAAAGDLVEELDVERTRAAAIDLGPDVEGPQLFTGKAGEFVDGCATTSVRQVAVVLGLEGFGGELDLAGECIGGG